MHLLYVKSDQVFFFFFLVISSFFFFLCAVIWATQICQEILFLTLDGWSICNTCELCLSYYFQGYLENTFIFNTLL